MNTTEQLYAFQKRTESLRQMVVTRDMLIADLERENRELRAANDRTWNEAVEAALLKLPGGNYCDPQEAADEIRQLKIALHGTPGEWDGKRTEVVA